MKRLKSPKLIKLNVAGGIQKIDGFTNIDIAKIKETDIVHDLNKYPWPIANESVEEIICSHYIEHIPHYVPAHPGKDGFFLFFDELYRILVTGGKATIIAPWYGSARWCQDPTHTRAICQETFLYLNRKNRQDMGSVQHYNVDCDFDFQCHLTVLPSNERWESRAAEARDFALRYYSNVIADVQAILTKNEKIDQSVQKNGHSSRRSQKPSVALHA